MSDKGHRFRLAINYGVAVLGVVATYFSSFSIFPELWKQDTGLLARISLIYFFVFLVVMFLIWAWRIYETIKKEKYANVTDEIHQINHHVRNFISRYSDASSADNRSADEYELLIRAMRNDFTLILDRICILFSVITGTRCRAALKSFYSVQDVLYTYTLCRDQKSKDNHLALDLKRREINHDALLNNSEFSRMSDERATSWYFFSNNLTKDKNFHSTSLSAYDRKQGLNTYTPSRFAQLFEAPRWSLPYKSTVTCAIRHPATDDTKYKNPQLLGFLAIDSESRGVFNAEWDVNLLFSFADALFHPLNLYNTVERIGARAGATLRPS
ncbi:MAG TPA: hypothetical protein VII56_04020 [Rhizomicrobium sp.]